MIRLYKIGAMVYYDIFTFTRTKERVVEFLFFPITSTVIWGLFAKSIAGISQETGMMFLLINIFWSFSYLFQSTANIQANMDVWSRSLNQLLVSGINEIEYILARLVFATLASLLVVSIMLGMASFYGLVLPSVWAGALLISATILASAIWSVAVLALYVRLGKEYAFLSWSFMQLVILLSAPFFPVETYPLPLQLVAKVLPHTWVFAALKEMANSGVLNMGTLMKAVLLSLAYLAVLFPLYVRMWRKAKRSGELVRLGK